MSTCVTDRAWLLGTAVALSALVWSGAAASAELEPRARAELEIRLHDLPEVYSDDDLTSFFDQYHGYWIKERRPTYLLDLAHLDLGLAREDDTYLLRFERWNPHWLNERGELDVNLRGLDLDLGYHRYRSDELRVFPTGTEVVGGILVFGSLYNPDTAATNPDGEDRRFFSRRTGLDGELRWRLDADGREAPILTEVHLNSRFEHRRGQIQDSFLLDKAKDVTEFDPVAETARFRGARREVDQDRFSVGGGLVLAPWQLFTSSLDLQFETFREEAPVLQLGDLFAIDPDIGDPAAIPWVADASDRAFNFVPDSNRLSVSLRISPNWRQASLHAGAAMTHLKQDSQAPVQSFLDLPDNEVTTYSANAAFDVPLDRRFSLNGFGKIVQRRRSFDSETFALLGAPLATSFQDEGQVDPFLERWRQLTGGLQLRTRLARAASVAAGYRIRRVDRDLRFSDRLNSIQPQEALVRKASERHTAYLQGRARLRRLLRLSGELGYEWAPRIGMPRELESALYFEGRGSYTLQRPFTVLVSVFGKIRGGKQEDLALAENGSRRKDFDQRKWSYGITLSALPVAETLIVASFAHDVDEQQFAHVRSPVERYDLMPTEFFLDSRPDYESDLRTLRLGGTHRLTPALDASLWSTFTWARLGFPDDESTSALPGNAVLLEATNRVRSRILSFEASLEYHLESGSRIKVGYRLDRFNGRQGRSSLDPDLTIHSVILGFSTDLELPWF